MKAETSRQISHKLAARLKFILYNNKLQTYCPLENGTASYKRRMAEGCHERPAVRQIPFGGDELQSFCPPPNNG